MKKLLLTLSLLVSAVVSAQELPWPVDVAMGQRWVGTNEAAFYGAARTYIPLAGVKAFGVTPYIVPELGFDRDTLLPYARAELTLDSDYATFAFFVTRMGESTRANIELRFCILSSRCSQ